MAEAREPLPDPAEQKRRGYYGRRDDPAKLQAYLPAEILGYIDHHLEAYAATAAAENWFDARGHAAAVMWALYERRNRGEDVTQELADATAVAVVVGPLADGIDR